MGILGREDGGCQARGGGGERGSGMVLTLGRAVRGGLRGLLPPPPETSGRTFPYSSASSQVGQMD